MRDSRGAACRGSPAAQTGRWGVQGDADRHSGGGVCPRVWTDRHGGGGQEGQAGEAGRGRQRQGRQRRQGGGQGEAVWRREQGGQKGGAAQGLQASLRSTEAKEAGADYVGLDEYLQKIKDGWTDVDVIVTMPSVMGKLGPLGRVLGPRGLMPNPKTGTVTMDVGKAVSDVKGGKIDFKVDKTGIVHASIGKVSFDADKILGNANELMQTLVKLKPSSAKGAYIKSVSMSSTMSPSIPVEFKNV